MSPFRGLNLGEVVRVQLGAKFSANQIIHLDHSPGSFGQNAHKNTSLYARKIAKASQIHNKNRDSEDESSCGFTFKSTIGKTIKNSTD